MSNRSDTLPSSRTWRDIPQQVKPRAMSTGGRRRLMMSTLRTVGGVVVVALLGWGAWEVASALQDEPKKMSAAVQTPPIKDLALVTDGVLSKPWLVSTLSLPKSATLMDLDLLKLRERLLASGQVRTASLTRNFPATLVATISERSPVARLMAQAAGEEAKVFLVARDGVVFAGAGFDPELIGTLPWLDGVKLTRLDRGFAPIAGMETVADLLGTARFEAEHLYRAWRVVSLAQLASDGELLVTAQDGIKIRFGTNEAFFRQLGRLDLVLDMARAQPGNPQAEINLALGSQVPVALGADPADLHPSRTGKPVSPAFPNLQRKTKREL